MSSTLVTQLHLCVQRIMQFQQTLTMFCYVISADISHLQLAIFQHKQDYKPSTINNKHYVHNTALCIISSSNKLYKSKFILYLNIILF